MIFDSIAVMTAIDIFIIALSAFGLRFLRSQTGTTLGGEWLISVGFGVVALFYLADLYVMWIMPLHAPRTDAMALMTEMHLNARWLVTLVSIPCIVIGFITMRKVLDRNVAEAATANARLNTILQTLPDALLVADEANQVIEANAAAENVFDRDVTGTNLTELFTNWRGDGTSSRLERLMGVKGDAHYFPTEVSSAPLADGAKMILVRDTSERSNLEAQLRQSQKLESLGRLAGGVAHDFNNYLTVIMGEAELLKLRGDADKAQQRIHEAATSAAELTNQLLSFSRKQILDARVTDLNRVIANLDGLLRNLLGEQVSLDTVQSGGLGRVKIDPTQMEQAIVDLAINARDAMPDGGKLTIETGNTYLDQTYVATHPEVEPGRYVMVAVTDNGTGMTPDIIERALEPFFTTKPRGRGTGLGLAMVSGFVKQSQGSISIYSEPGDGTTVRLYIPRVEDALEEREPERMFEDDDLRGSEKILLAEDADDVRDFVQDVLTTHGYEVVARDDVPTALTAIDESIDLIFTDIIMPSGTGFDLATEAQKQFPDLPVLYMTGYTENAIVHGGALDPGVKVVQKPFSVRGLLVSIRLMLDKPS